MPQLPCLESKRIKLHGVRNNTWESLLNLHGSLKSASIPLCRRRKQLNLLSQIWAGLESDAYLPGLNTSCELFMPTLSPNEEVGQLPLSIQQMSFSLSLSLSYTHIHTHTHSHTQLSKVLFSTIWWRAAFCKIYEVLLHCGYFYVAVSLSMYVKLQLIEIHLMRTQPSHFQVKSHRRSYNHEFSLLSSSLCM